MTKRTLLEKINRKACPSGKTRIFSRRVEVKATTGAPSSASTVGALLWNSYDGDAYICTVASGTWVKINA